MKDKKKKYDYNKKSNVFAVLGIAAEILLPGTPVGLGLLAYAALNAAGELYWHPERYADIIEHVRPMPEEYMTKEEIEAYNRHNDKIDELNEKIEIDKKGDEQK